MMGVKTIASAWVFGKKTQKNRNNVKYFPWNTEKPRFALIPRRTKTVPTTFQETQQTLTYKRTRSLLAALLLCLFVLSAVVVLVQKTILLTLTTPSQQQWCTWTENSTKKHDYTRMIVNDPVFIQCLQGTHTTWPHFTAKNDQYET